MLSNKQIQINLHFLGYYFGAYNGKMTLATKNSIKSFQRNNELQVDGIWGKNSNTKCIELIKWIQKKLGCKSIDGIVRPRNYYKNIQLPKINADLKQTEYVVVKQEQN